MERTQNQQQHVIIVGGGLAGALLACYLGQAGCRVEVFERRADPRGHGFAGGRSINLALSTRGITALREVGLADRVLADAIAMPGRMLHDRAGALAFQPYSKNPDDAINSVSRGGLNITLLDAAEDAGDVTLHFSRQCIDVDLEAPAVIVRDTESGREERIAADVLIGADGAFSAVRDVMLRQVHNFDYAQSFLEHGYKELSIPPGADGGFRIEPHALHIWPRGGSMMIALPNQDRSFTCTLFWPYHGAHSFEAIAAADDVLPLFREHYPDAVEHMPTLVEDYMSNPVGSLVTIRCAPWNAGSRVLLIGDASHAIVPFFGQGMNAAFEDCRILHAMMRDCGGDIGGVLEPFSRLRRDDADAIADMALENFIEMRDRTASAAFRMRKKLEQRLHAWLPGHFTPLYNMVSFTNIPYASAMRTAARQRAAIRRIGLGALAALAIGFVILLLIINPFGSS